MIKICPNNIKINQVSRTIAYTKKKPVCSQNKLTNASFKKNVFTKFSEADFFLFKKRKQVLIQHKKKSQAFFFTSVWRIIFYFSPPHTSKKIFVYDYKNPPSEEEKKNCLLANTYANETVGRPPRNFFFFNLVLTKTFLANKKKYLLVRRKFKWPNLTE